MAAVSPPGELEPIETASVDELRALQLERLRWSLRHAYDNVPYYRQEFDVAAIHPDDLKDLADLAKFPFTTKARPARQLPVRHVRGAARAGGAHPRLVGHHRPADRRRLHRGGRRHLGQRDGPLASAPRAAGPGDIVHVAYGYGLFTGGLGAHYGAEKLGCTVIPVSGGMTERQVTLIRDFQPDVIMVTPSYMLSIIDEMERQGLDPRPQLAEVRHLRRGTVDERDARRDGDPARGIDAIDIYGLSEVMGPGVAQECVETKDGLHVWEDHFYPEVIDPVTGEVLPDGERGELVFTSLTKQAMPVIRYRTRDLTRLLPGTARTMRRIEKITGRTDDMIILRGVNLFPTQIEELILGIPALSPHFQLHLSKHGNLDAMTIHVERRPDATLADAETAGTQLVSQVKNTIGVSAGIVVQAPDTIERSMGKMRRIIDERPR